jgi:hypothetical protein
MEPVFVINPKHKRKGRMPAGLRRYWASRRRAKNPKRHRARNPKHRRQRVMGIRRNPVVKSYRRRKARHHNPHYAKRRRRANPVFLRRSRRKRHHNPFSVSGLKGVLLPAAYGAGGALLMNVAYGYLAPQLPATLTTGYLPMLVKGAAAVGLGMLIGKFMSRQDGMYATVGGLTVVLLGAVTPMLQSAVPTLPGLSGLAGYGDYIPHRPMGAYAPSLQRAQTSRLGRLGFISPAPRVGMGAYMGRGAAGGDLSGSGFNGLNDGM